MSTIVKRPYHSPLRQAQAEATRARILDASLKLFAESGYAATTIAAVAREAGVVPETIYASFGTKKALMDGLIGRAAPPDTAATLETHWSTEAGNPHAQLGVIAAFAADFWERNDELARVLRQVLQDRTVGEEVLLDDLDRTSARDLTGGVTTHAVGDDVETQGRVDQHRVFVVLAFAANVSFSECFCGQHRART